MKESDWWWWYLALEMPDSLMKKDETLFQFVSITDPVAKTTFTIGCKTKIGTEGEMIKVYTHLPGQSTSLDSNSELVLGKTWADQAAELKEEKDDIVWTAGTAHVPTDHRAPASTKAGYTNHVCYFFQELPKIGRKPSDFDKNLDIKIGARLYTNDAATTFDSLPETTEQIYKAAPPSYVVQAANPAPAAPTAASSLFMSTLAALFMLFAVLN